MRNYFFIFILFLGVSKVQSQSIEDLNQLNGPILLGDARFMGIGGAFSSLGNNVTGLLYNPAGIAVYRHPQAVITMANQNFQNSAYLYEFPDQPIRTNPSTSANRNRFVFPNLGYIATNARENNSSIAYGLTFQQTHNFHNRFKVSGANQTSSIIDEWIQMADGIAPDDLGDFGLYPEQLAWDHFLIDENNGSYSTQATGLPVNQTHTITYAGSKNELGIAVGGNYQNKWYFGGSLNIVFSRLERSSEHYESGFTGDSIQSFTYKYTEELNGAGFNFRLGAIYRATEYWRLSFGFTSPTWSEFEQNTNFTMQTNFAGGGFIPETSIELLPAFWGHVAPPKFTFGTSLVLRDYGFISLDYTLTPHQWQSASSEEYNLGYLDQDIDDFLGVNHELRIGAETKVENWRIRGGVGYVTTPLNASTDEFFLQPKTGNLFWSLGLGYHAKLWGLDLAFTQMKKNQDYFMYAPSLGSGTLQTSRQQIISSTFFWKL